MYVCNMYYICICIYVLVEKDFKQFSQNTILNLKNLGDTENKSCIWYSNAYEEIVIKESMIIKIFT